MVDCFKMDSSDNDIIQVVFEGQNFLVCEEGLSHTESSRLRRHEIRHNYGVWVRVLCLKSVERLI